MDSGKNDTSTATPVAKKGTSGRFGDRLVELGIITASQLRVALEEQKRTGERVGEVLASLGFVRDEQIVKLVAEDLGIPFVKISEVQTDPSLKTKFDSEFLSQRAIAPLREDRGILIVATARPADVASIDQFQKALRKPLRVVAASQNDIREYLSGFSKQEVARDTAVGVDEVTDQVESLLERAIRERATDIHIEPDEKLLRVRLRIDGILRAADSFSVSTGQALVARVKVLANVDLAEHRRPQDGRFDFTMNGQRFDFRVSIRPTRHGENIVLRVLERNGGNARLEQLRLPKAVDAHVRKICDMPHGLFLVAGPTGSGKTTTLYSALRTIDAMARNVTSIEDPIEGDLPLVRQSQVDPSIGFGFAEGLRSLLRQDPDVVLVGEIRDRDTAEIAMRASLTGHLVFATLHANDSIAAVPRLLDMGIEPFLLNTSLIGVLAQRLVRMLCPACRFEDAPDDFDRALFGDKPPERVIHAKGCKKCGSSGFLKRAGIFELFMPDGDCRKIILNGCNATELRALAIHNGFKPMFVDSRQKVRDGITSSREVIRVSVC